MPTSIQVSCPNEHMPSPRAQHRKKSQKPVKNGQKWLFFTFYGAKMAIFGVFSPESAILLAFSARNMRGSPLSQPVEAVCSPGVSLPDFYPLTTQISHQASVTPLKPSSKTTQTSLRHRDHSRLLCSPDVYAATS
ncbi:MAG: hypothetical protein EOM12_12670 [Verrucomicrobiae bacterium]|nr:hypothetical protein [Verrucomicrobiae bacterium]